MTGKPWQKKRKSGRRGGAFYGAVKGGLPVNLQTQDPKVALERLRLLRAGKWTPAKKSDPLEAAAIADQLEADAAAAAVDAAQAGELPPAPSPEPAPAAPPAAPAPDPLPPPAAGNTVSPDAVLPPPATKWNEDAAAAAADAAPSGDEAGADGEPKAQYVSPDEILELVAKGVVEGGKMFGRWVARRQRKIPNTIESPEAQKMVAMLESMTIACTKQTMVDLAPMLAEDISPGWGMVAGFGMLAAVQFLGAPPDPNAPPDDDHGEK